MTTLTNFYDAGAYNDPTEIQSHGRLFLHWMFYYEKN